MVQLFSHPNLFLNCEVHINTIVLAKSQELITFVLPNINKLELFNLPASVFLHQLFHFTNKFKTSNLCLIGLYPTMPRKVINKRDSTGDL